MGQPRLCRNGVLPTEFRNCSVLDIEFMTSCETVLLMQHPTISELALFIIFPPPSYVLPQIILHVPHNTGLEFQIETAKSECSTAVFVLATTCLM